MARDGVSTFLLYSRRYQPGGGSLWFYGITCRDAQRLQGVKGELLFVLPHPGRSQFLWLDWPASRGLLRRCPEARDGDRKIHSTRCTSPIYRGEPGDGSLSA
jgi:hypothetical protein